MAGRVSPLEDLRPGRIWHKKTIRGAFIRVGLRKLSILDNGFNLPGSGRMVSVSEGGVSGADW